MNNISEQINFSHTPILLDEIIDYLDIKPDGIYVDCTLGGAGHSLEIVKRLSKKGRLIGIDKDKDALTFSKTKLKDYDNVTYIHNDFKEFSSILNDLNIDKIDGCLIDLGVSSYQLDNGERGFSFRFDAPLDMRMDQSQPISAYDVVNTYSYEELVKILFDYGEEQFAKLIVKNIIKHRELKPIKTTGELNSIIEECLPAKIVYKSGGAAKKTFQAIRIEVNGELDELDKVLKDICLRLKSGGRLCVLSFHSLEDRIVKNVIKELSIDCICPPGLPVCVCHHKSTIKPITKKPVLPSLSEQKINSRSTCAKLRVAEKK